MNRTLKRTITALAAVAAIVPLAGLAASRYQGEVESSRELVNSIRWYGYDSGPRLSVPPGTGDAYNGAVLNGDGNVMLDRWIPGTAAPQTIPVAWWDQAFLARQCFTATGVGVQLVDVPFDSTAPAPWAASGWIQSDYGDLVAVAAGQPAPFWLQNASDTATNLARVQVDFSATPNTTRDICLYFGNQAGGLVSNSDANIGGSAATLTAAFTGFESAYMDVGTWQAVATVDTDVWGLFDAGVGHSAQTDVTWTIGCGDAQIGPFDPAVGTAVQAPIPHGCDGNDFAQITATLVTADRFQTPVFSAPQLEYSPVELPFAELAFELPYSPGPTNVWMFRINGDPVPNMTESFIESRTASADADWNLSLGSDATGLVPQVAGIAPDAVTAPGAAPVAFDGQSVHLAWNGDDPFDDEVVWRTVSTGAWSERTVQFVSEPQPGATTTTTTIPPTTTTTTTIPPTTTTTTTTTTTLAPPESTPPAGPVEVFADTFESFAGYTTYGLGDVVAESSLAHTGSGSAHKITNSDPNGATKPLGTTVDDFTLEAWVHRPTSATGGSADRIGLLDANGNGYSFTLQHSTGTADLFYIDRRDNGVATIISSQGTLDTPKDTWYRFRLERSGTTLTASLFNSSGNVAASVTTTDATHGSLDRFAILGGYDFYVDDVTVTVPL